jgi:hypothetical protein
MCTSDPGPYENQIDLKIPLLQLNAELPAKNPYTLLENRNVPFFSWEMDLARSSEGLRHDVHGR